MRDTMIIYRSFYDSIKCLTKEQKADVYEAIFEYGLNFKEVELEGISKAIFTLIKPVLDTNIKNYNNGNKPKGSQKEAKKKRTKSQRQAYKDKDKEVDKDKDKDKDIYRTFKHLSISQIEVDRIIKDGYSLHEIDTILDSIENYANNKNYVSLNLTARKWLKNEYGEREAGKTQKDFKDRTEYLKYCVKNNLTPEQA